MTGQRSEDEGGPIVVERPDYFVAVDPGTLIHGVGPTATEALADYETAVHEHAAVAPKVVGP